MSFPDLTLAKWEQTRNTIHMYARVVGLVRQQIAPKQKHWWHGSLRAAAVGLTTTPMRAEGKTIELTFNYFTHELRLRSSTGEEDFISLVGQTLKEFSDELVEILSDMGVTVKIKKKFATNEDIRPYDDSAVEAYWDALSQIDQLLKVFRASLREETSPVQLWPHHFDLAMVWFSGRKVPGQDINNPDYADEQMNFGFATGDEYVKEPYFYITAYPMQDELYGCALPEPAYWINEGLTAAILPYAALTTSDDPDGLLLEFWQAAHEAGSALMR